MVLYLRAVFMFDFYSGIEFSFEHNRCDRVHTLAVPKVEGESRADSDWQDKLDARLRQADDLGKLIEQLELDQCDNLEEIYVQNHCQQVKEGVHKCTLCSKMFQGPEFVIKHINNKHQTEVG